MYVALWGRIAETLYTFWWPSCFHRVSPPHGGVILCYHTKESIRQIATLSPEAFICYMLPASSFLTGCSSDLDPPTKRNTWNCCKVSMLSNVWVARGLIGNAFRVMETRRIMSNLTQPQASSPFHLEPPNPTLLPSQPISPNAISGTSNTLNPKPLNPKPLNPKP